MSAVESGLRGQRILLTGATGAVAAPIVRALAPVNEVTAMARFGDSDAARALEARGVATIALDLAGDGWDVVPDAFNIVLHFVVDRGTNGSFNAELRASGAGTVTRPTRVAWQDGIARMVADHRARTAP